MIYNTLEEIIKATERNSDYYIIEKTTIIPFGSLEEKVETISYSTTSEEASAILKEEKAKSKEDREFSYRVYKKMKMQDSFMSELKTFTSFNYDIVAWLS